MLRNSSFQADRIDLRHDTSRSKLSNSFSSKHSFTTYNSLANSTITRKGYSFGGASRKTMMQINLHSPAPKYSIPGLVEINLNAKKGATFGSSRESSVEKTTLSYIGKTLNPGPGTYHQQILSKSNSAVRIGKSNNQGLKVQFLNEKAINKNPGPGTYQPKVVKLKGGKITSKSKRFQKHNKENMPGPGAYNFSNMDFVSTGSKNSYPSVKLSQGIN